MKVTMKARQMNDAMLAQNLHNSLHFTIFDNFVLLTVCIIYLIVPNVLSHQTNPSKWSVRKVILVIRKVVGPKYTQICYSQISINFY